MTPSTPSSSVSLHSSEPPSLLSVLKALPADCVRNNLVSAFGRLGDPDSTRDRPPIGGHQWLPGQWTPILYGLSHDWRVYSQCVLTRVLTIDLAITVSLQRPCNGGSPLESLESFLAGFPSLQHLTVLAGNGGAPVDDSNRPPPTSGFGGSSTMLAMAESINVALAAQQLLRLDCPETTSQSPRLASLELRLHPSVWRVLRGSDPDEFLARLAVSHPSLESLTVNIAPPLMPGSSLPSSPATFGGGVGQCDGPVAVVGVSSLATLPGLRQLRFVGPIVVEGLAGLTQLQSLTLEGVHPPTLECLPALTALSYLHMSDSHLRPTPSNPPQSRIQNTTAAVLTHFTLGRVFSNLRALHLPNVAVGPKEWPVVAALCPALRELELANMMPLLPGSNSSNSSGSGGNGVSGSIEMRTAAAAAAAIAGGNSSVPDWFLRATVGDEAAYSNGSVVTTSVGSGSGGPNKVQLTNGGPWSTGMARRGHPGPEGEYGSPSPKGSFTGAVSRCPFAALAANAGSGGAAAGPVVTSDGGKRGDGRGRFRGSAPLTGVQRLTLWEYMTPPQMVDVLQLTPDLRELRGSLLLDDPPDVPAAGLRPAAVAVLRPLAQALQPIRDVRLSVSCDPAAVTGQLAGLFLMESGLADVAGIQGLSLTVWVAAETQLGSLAALRQLRSLDLTLGKQEQESELSVLTRLERLSYLSLRITPGIWNEIQGRTGRVTAGAALRLAMSFAAGQMLLMVADVHREICEDEAISLVKSVEMTTGQPGAAWAVSAWVEETAECILGFGPSAGGSGTLGGGGGGGEGGGVLRVVWTPELVRRLLGVVAAVEGRGGPGPGGLAVSFMGSEEERLGRVLGS
ncbi:hypothetical protein VaNZ11_012196 [Volvox africanus]|uniref:Uncharacterized protein n=1 Tax=Volvox africanus TaxID=51714 RepID=A0ABQ5SEL6_9CHLO|nr:hypothetical protein VaNZ11_012196 [Volvox africanus]